MSFNDITLFYNKYTFEIDFQKKFHLSPQITYYRIRNKQFSHSYYYCKYIFPFKNEFPGEAVVILKGKR